MDDLTCDRLNLKDNQGTFQKSAIKNEVIKRVWKETVSIQKIKASLRDLDTSDEV